MNNNSLRKILIFGFLLYIQIIKAQLNQPEIYGHRGFRGKFPENSILGFQKAIELGITGIELDVVVNKDKQLVISHEPFFQKEYCLDSIGKEIKNESDFNIYHLNQKEIELFDCGTKFHSKFPDQFKIKSVKPLLQTFFTEVNLINTIILFEVKSEFKEYNVSQPEPDEYSNIILDELKNFKYKSNIRIMCFDAEILEQIHKKDPSYPLVYLTYLPKSSNNFLKKLSFKPYALGMFYPTINNRSANQLHQKNIKLFSWTVNDLKQKEKMMNLGVDAIITDFPDVFK